MRGWTCGGLWSILGRVDSAGVLHDTGRCGPIMPSRKGDNGTAFIDLSYETDICWTNWTKSASRPSIPTLHSVGLSQAIVSGNMESSERVDATLAIRRLIDRFEVDLEGCFRNELPVGRFPIPTVVQVDHVPAYPGRSLGRALRRFRRHASGFLSRRHDVLLGY